MNSLKHWFVCLDLSKMDEVLIRYVHFLAEILNPSTISFLHIIESDLINNDLKKLFPELETDNDIEELIREELSEKVEKHFNNSSVENRLIIKQGSPTDAIINIMQSLEPDLLVMGKKSGYQGEGELANKIVRYVPSSVLFVPETSRHTLKNILVPTDFSEYSAQVLKAVNKQFNQDDFNLYAQHIFRYPTHFFPHFPSEKEDLKINSHLSDKKNSFIKEYEIPNNAHFILSFLKNGKLADEVYSEIVRNQINLIVLGKKGDKKLSSLLQDDFTDKMIQFTFGIPLLLLKNKKKHTKYLDIFNS